MQVAPGARLGPYEISARVGAGGMGEVFRARDTRIGREVAIKVLPASLVSNDERLHRFEQESRAAGALNHPNLVTIYDVGAQQGAPYIVMELLEGETLREKIGEGITGQPTAPRIPIRKAIDYSMQMASGLAAAHEKGIVHRDLKPENVFVTNDGRVKILDFGLAKLSAAANDESADDRTQQRNTTPGTVMGTAGYMSPEQVRGQQVDHRTDIFSFGAILYEMLSGRRAFRRDSSVETMNAILTEDPPELTGSSAGISPGLERIVRRCMEKNPAERFRDAHDMSFALEAVTGSTSGTGPAVAAATGRPRPRVSAVTAVAMALIAIGLTSLIAFRLGRPGAAVPEPRFSQLTFDAGTEREPTLAPDGKTFAFVKSVGGQADIFLQRVDGRSAINLTKDSSVDDDEPAFSPDGNQIAFRSSRDGGGIFVMGATGESVRRLTNEGCNPSWSPDGSKIVYASEPVFDPRGRSTISKLSVVDTSSGVARVLYPGDAIQPNWSPHGDRIAFWAIDRGGRRDLYTIAASGDPKSVVALTADEPLDWNPVWSPDGAFVYFSSDRDGTMNLWRIAVDEKSGRPQGAPQSFRTPSPYVAFISIARSGSQIIYGSVSNTGELLRATFDPQSERLSPDPAPVFSGSMLLRTSGPSPDGKQIAFTTQGRQEDVFVMKSDGTDVRQLTNDAARDRGVSWWADSSRIVFYSNRSGTYAVWSIRPDGSGLTQLTADSALSANFPHVSADGRRLAYYAIEGTAQVADISGSLPAPRTEALPPLPDRTAGFTPYAWSPDGRSIAGIPWIGSGLYVYSIPEKRYRRLKPEAGMCGWIDDQRILFFDVDFRRVGVVDVASDRVRLVGALGAVSSDLAGNAETVSISNNAHNLLVYNRHSDGDIWQMTLGGK